MIKKLAGYIKDYKKNAILAPLFVSLEVVMETVIPLLMARIIDQGIDGGDISAILRIGAILLGCAVLSLFFGIMSGRNAAIASAGFAKNIRKGLYDNTQEFSFSNIDKFSSASLITRLTTDVTNLQNAFQMIIRIAVRSPIMLIMSMFMAFSINSELSLVFLAAIPLLAIGLFFMIRSAHPMFEKVFKTYDKMNSVVEENLTGIRVVKSYVREDFEIQKFKNVSNEIYLTFSKAEKLLAFNAPLMQFAIYGCILALSWLGAKMIVGGSMTTGELVGLMSYTGQILMSLMMFSMVLVMITISRASAERITEVLNEHSDLKNGLSPVYEISDASISFENVTFCYPYNNKNSLNSVNLSILSGETIGIIGGTGSSKTTLVQLIPRLYEASSGTVKVGGRNVKDYDLASLRHSIAMVLQKNTLFSGTIAENLRWGNENATEEELVRVCKLAQADDFISSFPDGYNTHIEQGGSNVSGGQKQRLCIARALLKKPKILILDDSTSAVDTKTDKLLRQSLRDEIPDTTKIIIAQRISSVEEADKIIVMDKGEISAVGTHTALLKESLIYREVYESQQKGGGEHEEA